MTTEKKINEMNIGDEVFCGGVRCKIMSVKLGMIAGPHYGLLPIELVTAGKERELSGLTSYRLCSLSR